MFLLSCRQLAGIKLLICQPMACNYLEVFKPKELCIFTTDSDSTLMRNDLE